MAAHFARARRSSRSAGAPTRSRSATGPSSTRTTPEADQDRDQVSAILDAVDELVAEGPGDILVFLAGEREIRDTQDALAERDLRGTEIVPLYSRLSAADQHKVFAPHAGRRIVLATNVAETSLTVPGIRYVIDPGTARISRYSHRTKVQRLPIEPVSQASARQRSGRCGRLGPGIAIRLYTRGRLRRPARSSPTPRSCAPTWPRCCCRWPRWTWATSRTSRSSTRRTAAPSPTAWRCWRSCGALDEHGKLTPTGRSLAALPLDPRMARMVVEADRRGVLEEVLVIAAGLTIQDPRERPTEHQQAADELHAPLRRRELRLPGPAQPVALPGRAADALSGNQFRRTVKREFLHYLRIREWQDLHGQLRGTARRLGMNRRRAGGRARRAGHHAALLAGLLSHVGHAGGAGQAAGTASRAGRDGSTWAPATPAS